MSGRDPTSDETGRSGLERGEEEGGEEEGGVVHLGVIGGRAGLRVMWCGVERVGAPGRSGEEREKWKEGSGAKPVACTTRTKSALILASASLVLTKKRGSRSTAEGNGGREVRKAEASQVEHNIGDLSVAREKLFAPSGVSNNRSWYDQL